MIKVNNLPANYTAYRFITARMVDGAYWFFGAWGDNFDAALAQAVEFDAQLLGADMVVPA